MKQLLLLVLFGSICTLLLIVFVYESEQQQKELIEQQQKEQNTVYGYFKVHNTSIFECSSIRNAIRYNDTHCRYIVQELGDEKYE